MTTTMRDMTLEARPDLNADLSRQAIQQDDFQTEEMLVNMGPQHPATHGVLRVVLRTDGEMVLEAVPHIGYLHRCAEKIGENVAPYQYIPYTDRMDYLAGMNDNLAFALACEKLAGLEKVAESVAEAEAEVEGDVVVPESADAAPGEGVADNNEGGEA